MKISVFFVLLLNSIFSYALIQINVTSNSENRYPIIVRNFILDKNIPENIKKTLNKVIIANLNRSGRFDAISVNDIISGSNELDFNKWRSYKVEALVVGNIKLFDKNTYKVSFSIFEVYTERKIYTKSFFVRNNSIRTLAHKISDLIFTELLDEHGDFNTNLAYVKVTKEKKGKLYTLSIADSDGYNVQNLIISSEPILSPSLSPDGSRIAYVSFENGRSEIFIDYLWVRRDTIKLPVLNGISSAPSWNYQGDRVAFTLSKDGNKDIYIYDLINNRLQRITYNESIDTEASFSPDNKYLIFTSDRSGNAQIYRYDLSNKNIKRLTYKGIYNAKGSYNSMGDKISILHKNDAAGGYNIAILDANNTNDLFILTKTLADESPSFSPNGNMVVYSSKKGYNNSILNIVSIDGKNRYEILETQGSIREPSWSK